MKEEGRFIRVKFSLMVESKEMPVSQGLINDTEVFQFVVWSEIP